MKIQDYIIGTNDTPLKWILCLLHFIPSSKRTLMDLAHHVEGENTQGWLHLKLHEEPVEDVGVVEEEMSGRVCKMMLLDCGILLQFRAPIILK